MIITGPAMRVKYGGCRYDSVVFVDIDLKFLDWLHGMEEFLINTITRDPAVYCTYSEHPSFTTFPVVNGEFRVKLSSNAANSQQLTTLVTRHNELVDPSNVYAGSTITPILRVYYYTDRKDDFGLSFTMLKGVYEPGPTPINQMSTELWELDKEAKDNQ